MRVIEDGGYSWLVLRLWPFRRWVRLCVELVRSRPAAGGPYGRETRQSSRAILSRWGWPDWLVVAVTVASVAAGLSFGYLRFGECMRLHIDAAWWYCIR